MPPVVRRLSRLFCADTWAAPFLTGEHLASHVVDLITSTNYSRQPSWKSTTDFSHFCREYCLTDATIWQTGMTVCTSSSCLCLALQHVCCRSTQKATTKRELINVKNSAGALSPDPQRWKLIHASSSLGFLISLKVYTGPSWQSRPSGMMVCRCSSKYLSKPLTVRPTCPGFC